MNITRDYYRKMRAKHIKRKKRIASHYPGSDIYPYYQEDGMYSKNKIHCSCPLCKEKAWYGKHMLTKQEQKAQLKQKEESYDNEIFCSK